MSGDHDLRLEPGKDATPVVAREATSGYPREEVVDLAHLERVVVEVRAALVVEGRVRDLDLDSPHLAAAISPRG